MAPNYVAVMDAGSSSKRLTLLAEKDDTRVAQAILAIAILPLVRSRGKCISA